ncbi:MAG TPA: ethanolamine ammonia-lyase subunit EutC [Usitatibacteraceae bacterium]
MSNDPDKPVSLPSAADPWTELRRHTPARIALGRSGASLPTAEVLRFAAAHAQARDAVHIALDVPTLEAVLRDDGWTSIAVHSRAPDRDTYLRRPDWGRRIDMESTERLRAAADKLAAAPIDLVVVIGDGLSAVAVQRYALPLLHTLRVELGDELHIAPLVIASQARVALADEIGELLKARAALILLGERPGLSSPDSIGAYLTFAPKVGRSDAERNCVSNIRPEGLAPAPAAKRIAWLLREAMRRQLSGVTLKDDSALALLAP